jgi:Toprim-like
VSSTAPALSLSELEAFDPHIQGRGSERRARCPFCQSTERAFHFNAETLVYNCKRASCGVTGKFSDAWQDRPKNPKKRAHDRLQHELDELRNPQPPSLPPTAATWHEHCLCAKPLTGTPGAAYLQSRGIINSVLPYIARGCLYHPLFYFGQRPAVVFPFRDKAGEPVAVSARFIDGKPKGHLTLGPKSTGAFITNLAVWTAPVIVLTEAPIDALSLAACGVPAVALGGTEGPQWLPGACVFKHVVLATDNDENSAGDNATAKLAPVLQSYGAKTARLKPRGAKDWNDMLQRYDIATLSSWLHARLSHIARFEFQTSQPGQWWPFAWFSDARGE